MFDLEALKSATVEFDESSIVALNQTYGSETLTLDINPLQVRAERPELLPQAPASGAYLPVMFGKYLTPVLKMVEHKRFSQIFYFVVTVKSE